MTKKLILLLIICAFNFINAQEKTNSIIGKWIGVDERNESGVIEFLDNGKAKLSVMGREMPAGEYKTDFSKNPIWINITIKNKGKSMILYGLAKFIDKDTIKWEVFPMLDKQPKDFSKNSINTIVILKRSK